MNVVRGVLGLAILLVGLSACRSGTATEASGDAERPNVILIMADDLGYGDLGAYGQEHIRTPALDRLAKEGAVFTQFYAGSAVCAPSRSVLMTGQHTGHTPIRGNREIMPIGQHPLPDSAVTVAEVLQEAGYRTAAMGKWGLGPPGSEGRPLNQGFDLFYGYLGQRRAHFYYPEFLFYNGERSPLPGNEVVEDAPVPGSGHPVRKGTYSHDAITDSALAFIRRNSERPFFLYLPSTIPHIDFMAPEDSWEPYLDEEGNSIFPETPFEGGHYTAQAQPNAAYAAMVSRLDRDVGRIRSLVEKLDLGEETIILFTSDNGPTHLAYDRAFFDSNGSFRGGKRDLYEGGIRVPMIAWGPGRVPAGVRSDVVWAMWDLMPTLADWAGVELDGPTGERIDGISFAPALRGEEDAQPRHDHLYWEIFGGQSAQAVRAGRWKAVRQPPFTGEIELYDLVSNPTETRDLSAFYPEVTARMDSLLEHSRTESEIFGPTADR